ncbi:hypothetical protein E2C01_023170 [Portunus trituberculatus]|uniref:Uncharacterized protein n=1 Tax=Portunus trituberculatus TaxID=210409 RepID=A0A5B7E989_PORTR|nr:hypothetical protein [Portunus trituberculatus]
MPPCLLSFDEPYLYDLKARFTQKVRAELSTPAGVKSVTPNNTWSIMKSSNVSMHEEQSIHISHTNKPRHISLRPYRQTLHRSQEQEGEEHMTFP